jgi:hypothetical protein
MRSTTPGTDFPSPSSVSFLLMAGMFDVQARRIHPVDVYCFGVGFFDVLSVTKTCTLRGFSQSLESLVGFVFGLGLSNNDPSN